jgi:hypothetical protein
MISEAKRAVILMVEDESLIRMNAVEMIEEAYKVVEAGNADEAIVILERRLDIAVLSPTFRCRAAWMVSSLLPLFDSGGPRSRSWPPQAKSK